MKDPQKFYNKSSGGQRTILWIIIPILLACLFGLGGEAAIIPGFVIGLLACLFLMLGSKKSKNENE
jgi:hypothetical protein